MIKPSDCYFCFAPDDECDTTFVVVEKSFWNKHRHLDDQMRGETVQGLDQFDELMEATFCGDPEETEADVRARLLSLGFEEKSDLTF